MVHQQPVLGQPVPVPPGWSGRIPASRHSLRGCRGVRDPSRDPPAAPRPWVLFPNMATEFWCNHPQNAAGIPGMRVSIVSARLRCLQGRQGCGKAASGSYRGHDTLWGVTRDGILEHQEPRWEEIFTTALLPWPAASHRHCQRVTGAASA